jgi:hypothetical protein
VKIASGARGAQSIRNSLLMKKADHTETKASKTSATADLARQPRFAEIVKANYVYTQSLNARKII